MTDGSSANSLGEQKRTRPLSRPSKRGLLLAGVVAAVAGAGVAIWQLRAPKQGELFVTVCDAMSPILKAQVEWRKVKRGAEYVYTVESVRAPSGEEGWEGWQLHHRPAEGFPNNHLQPDVQVFGKAIRDVEVGRRLMADVPLTQPAGMLTTSTLTCPNGDCLFSPLSGCKATYQYNMPGARVAVTGDSLVMWDDLCGLTPPAAPDYCAEKLVERLERSAARVFLQSNMGQGFASWLNVIRETATTKPDVYIMALGTNDAKLRQATATDANRPKEREETVRVVNEAVREVTALNPKVCIVLVTASENALQNDKQAFVPHYREEAAFVNELLTKVVAEGKGGLRELADFAKAAREHCGPNWLTDPTVTCDWFKPDQLHLVGKGNDARDPLIVEAYERCRRKQIKAP